ncbi:MAG: hypothetical protein C0483_06550 [Pirellula sp.]|nr:hypothetical protein [Pirellula sp.]
MNPQKLLIADADVKLVETLATHFRSRGFEVKTAYDALTILKLVHLDTPDAFVLDINLQCRNGICVCELLSDERRFSFIPAILLTETAQDALKHDCHGLRATYVAKGTMLPTRVEQALSKVASREPMVFAAT